MGSSFIQEPDLLEALFISFFSFHANVCVLQEGKKAESRIPLFYVGV